MRVAARTAAVELFLPFHHIAFAAVFGDQIVHLIAALARAALLGTGKCEAYRHTEVFWIISHPSLDNMPQFVRLGSCGWAKRVLEFFHDFRLLHAIKQTWKIGYASRIRPTIRVLLAHFVQRQDCRSWLDC